MAGMATIGGRSSTGSLKRGRPAYFYKIFFFTVFKFCANIIIQYLHLKQCAYSLKGAFYNG